MMAIPVHLQQKLDEYDAADAKAADEQQAQQAQDDVDGTSLANDEHDVTDSLDSGFKHEENAEEVVGETHVQETRDDNFKRMEGRYKAQIKRLEEQLAEFRTLNKTQSLLAEELPLLREENVRLRQQLLAQQSQHETPSPSEHQSNNSYGLTDEEYEMFGDMAPAVEKLARSVTAPLQAEIERLKAEQSKVDESLAGQSEAMFIEQVKAAVPNFSDATADNPAWVEFLSRAIPFTDMTMQHALLNAHQSRDILAIQRIFSEFAKVSGVPTANQQQKGKQSLSDLATPNRTSVNPSKGQRAKYKRSDYNLKVQQMRSGLISKEDFISFDRDFTTAERQGLVAE